MHYDSKRVSKLRSLGIEEIDPVASLIKDKRAIREGRVTRSTEVLRAQEKALKRGKDPDTAEEVIKAQEKSLRKLSINRQKSLSKGINQRNKQLNKIEDSKQAWLDQALAKDRKILEERGLSGESLETVLSTRQNQLTKRYTDHTTRGRQVLADNFQRNREEILADTPHQSLITDKIQRQNKVFREDEMGLGFGTKEALLDTRDFTSAFFRSVGKGANDVLDAPDRAINAIGDGIVGGSGQMLAKSSNPFVSSLGNTLIQDVERTKRERQKLEDRWEARWDRFNSGVDSFVGQKDSI